MTLPDVQNPKEIPPPTPVPTPIPNPAPTSEIPRICKPKWQKNSAKNTHHSICRGNFHFP